MKLSLLVSAVAFCWADWIDPDTPYEAHTVESYPPNVPIPPAYAYDDDYYSSYDYGYGFNNTNATNITFSPAPSASPTESPTESPTTSPTMQPTPVPKQYTLVFSDEFNTPGRTFEDGTDPRWTALDKNDYTNDALHYYSPKNAVTNENGELVITSEAHDTEVVGFDDVKLKNTHVTKHFRSAMLQTWNKFCFTGGVVEIEATLPGKHDVGGLWPAFWLLGNLARHTYVGTSNHVWPWSSTKCTSKARYAQAINGCMNTGHFGLQAHVGRGSPEIDIFEMQPGNVRRNMGPYLRSPVGQPFMSASYQLAPGRPEYRPGPGYWPGPGQWYDGLKGGIDTAPNIAFYGSYNYFLDAIDPAKEDYWSDAISYNRQLDAEFYKKPHVYRLEWEVPSDTTDGYLNWFLDGDLVLSINGTGIVDAGNGAEISSEPMYLILNTAISKQWGFPFECPLNCPCSSSRYDCRSSNWDDTCGFSDGFCDMIKKTRPEYKINWVRVYQDPNNELHKVGCSTPERPTRRYIAAHEYLYKMADDVHPLKGIQRGRGVCTFGATGVSKESCGGPRRGRCTEGRACECMAGWTGPHCLTNQAGDPILYDQPDKISDIGFIPPRVSPAGLSVGFCVLLFLLVLVCIFRDTVDNWAPIPVKESEEIIEEEQ